MLQSKGRARENRPLDRASVRYGIAVIAAAAGFLLRLALVGVFGGSYPYVTFYPAVMLAAVLGGLGPGLVAMAITALMAAFWIFPPAGFAISSPSDIVSLALFSLMGVFMSVVAELYHRARQKAAEYEKTEALVESEEQFRTMADAMPQLAWMANPDGYIFWYNQRWYEYTGTTPDQMEGWGWQSVHDPYMLPKVLEQWKESIATGRPLDMEFPLLGANGKFRWFLTRVRPLKDSDGRVVRWFGTNTDVSEKRELEDHRLEFYRRTIQAATGGKLVIMEREEIGAIAGPAVATVNIEKTQDLPKARAIAVDIAQSQGMEEDQIHKLSSAIGEATSNALKHAGGGRMSVHKKDGCLFVVVSDHGRGIDTLNLPDVALTLGFSTVGTGGLGYKMIIASARKVYLATGLDGTTVAFDVGLRAE